MRKYVPAHLVEELRKDPPTWLKAAEAMRGYVGEAREYLLRRARERDEADEKRRALAMVGLAAKLYPNG